MPSLKELAQREDRLCGGHRLCPGCSESIIVRQVLLAADGPVVASNATGCLEVATSIFPYTAWKIPWFHSAFENAAATISGIESAYRALRRRGKVNRDIYFIAFGGDGGTYDIGLQSLSGALERYHKFLYVCLNNEAYMNTGIQRSSATPQGTWTTTSPVGDECEEGKSQHRKDLTAIVAAHNIPYVAQTVPSRPRDLAEKVEKALAADGPAFLNVLTPCTRGWRFDPSRTLEMAELAIETCAWPLFEVIDGEWIVNYKPKEKKPIEEYLKPQGRYSHIFQGKGNRALLEHIQVDIDREWARLLRRAGETST
jgi:pyruvate ferredoxin oxidoreductase beta subunit